MRSATTSLRAAAHKQILFHVFAREDNGAKVLDGCRFHCRVCLQTTAPHLDLESHLRPSTRHFLREMAPPGRGCVVWTVGLVSAPSYPRRLSRPHHQSHTAHDTVELLARGHRRSSCTCNIKNNSTPPRHPVSSPVASRVSALLPPVGGDAVKPSSVPDDVGAKCSGSCGLW